MADRATLVTALIVERPMCEECIAEKSGLGVRDLEAMLAVIATALQVHDTVGRCRVCGETKRVLALEPPAR